ncbi:hypothetical protein [Arthrobacter sp. FW306-2-2C-D06B]|uniref:hypothetical protein n=1 Tax=Arthrobacter sp. FW306-2-2C-D06B TaxID=2879618 RepID=UPI001F2B3EEE|nr:hypothetical protein [Arthrobacter sp. FW306-2-2C-D06B]UKA60611.1 hypothetical protein LFT47_09895 [Arthrobacter sp. FW306-2-2C-D06B]
MGKASRQGTQKAARSIKIHDASAVISALETAARLQNDAAAAAGAYGTLNQWAQSPVMLRVDHDFAIALADTDANVEITGDWLDKQAYGAVGFSFPDPLVLSRSNHIYRYNGLVACGITLTGTTTTYGPIGEAAGILCLWTYSVDDLPIPGLQPVIFMTRGELIAGQTLGDYIAEAARRQDFGGDKAVGAFMTSLSLQLMLYLGASDRDVDWVPPASVARPHHMRDAQIGNLGWRVGQAFRQIRGHKATERPDDSGSWRMPPHIRRAHYQRVRVAARDESGRIIGSQRGAEGIDWAYETRWIPPTPVKAASGIGPVVHDLISPGH